MYACTRSISTSLSFLVGGLSSKNKKKRKEFFLNWNIFGKYTHTPPRGEKVSLVAPKNNHCYIWCNRAPLPSSFSSFEMLESCVRRRVRERTRNFSALSGVPEKKRMEMDHFRERERERER